MPNERVWVECNSIELAAQGNCYYDDTTENKRGSYYSKDAMHWLENTRK